MVKLTRREEQATTRGGEMQRGLKVKGKSELVAREVKKISPIEHSVWILVFDNIFEKFVFHIPNATVIYQPKIIS